MKPVFPKKLKAGDEIRVIAPATSLNVVSEAVRDLALRNFKALGFEISFSANSEVIDLFNSSSIQARVDDIHAHVEREVHRRGVEVEIFTRATSSDQPPSERPDTDRRLAETRSRITSAARACMLWKRRV